MPPYLNVIDVQVAVYPGKQGGRAGAALQQSSQLSLVMLAPYWRAKSNLGPVITGTAGIPGHAGNGTSRSSTRWYHACRVRSNRQAIAGPARP